MAFNKLYSGSFVSRCNHIIKVDILRDGDAPASVGELDFPADSPLTIEWSADGKMETIQGSTATLTIISPGDRTYLGLYTSVVGSVRMDVYRDGSLWWTGTLDTEFYEEPFVSNKDYDVTLTFEDFGSLERLLYNIDEDVPTLDSIVDDALERLNLAVLDNTRGVSRYELMMTTRTKSTEETDLSSIGIRSENFIDEDGEVSNMKDVIEGILKPLDLHMRQWAGKVWIFDNNALAKTTPVTMTWDSNDQVLGVDSVANSVTVTFSPYAENEVVPSDLFSAGFTPDRSLAKSFGTEPTSATDAEGNPYLYSDWYIDNLNDSKTETGWDSNYVGFRLSVYNGTSEIEKGMEVSDLLGLCHFDSFGNGDTTDAVYKYIRKHTTDNSNVGGFGSKWTYRKTLTHNPYMTLPDFFCPARPATGEYFLCLKMPFLLSVSYNPFGSESQGEAGNVEKFTKRAGYVMIPFRARLYNEDGSVSMHYNNTYFTTDTAPSIYNTQGVWTPGDYTNGVSDIYSCAWLSYYSQDDRKTKNGLDGGWSENRQFVNINKHGEFPSFKNLGTGQYMVMPPQPGRVEIIIEEGFYIYDWGNSGSTDTTLLGDIVSTTQDLYNYITWHAYKQPTLDIMKYTGGVMEAVSSEDIEYKGTLLSSAKDDMSVDTICGTAKSPILGARGQYIKTSNGNQLCEMYREGRTEVVEQLLIGTYHSHYASRHAKLTGTVKLSDGEDLTTYKDSILSIPMVMTSANVNIIADECEGTFIETNSDEYEND